MKKVNTRWPENAPFLCIVSKIYAIFMEEFTLLCLFLKNRGDESGVISAMKRNNVTTGLTYYWLSFGGEKTVPKHSKSRDIKCSY